MIEWQDLHHSELSVSQLYALLQLRCAVFVVEQNCPYQDIDGDDLEPVVIGRVIVSEALRGEKVGQQLMSKTLETCTHHWPDKPVYLGAQAHLQNFYQSFGFIPVTEVYEEDGIPHIGMAREVIQA
ncbi:TPA: GNAT family N-acetyltransferase [Escherichia coli]|nr:GNAT family N-acetyltransferase [Escherichia coli]